MRNPRRYWAVFVVLVVGVLVAVVAWQAGHRSAQITLRMKPAAPLTVAACVAEVGSYGYSAGAARNICAFGRARSWYHAVITNKGPGAYPSCQATAFDSHGKAVFSGALAFMFGGFPAGLFVPGYRSTAFDWYLPRRISGTVMRYVATCSVNSHPPV